jgi:sugar O-acyltransferase (sialic acid O-acetyltransferase NeuD family)
MQKIIIFGAGGLAREVAFLIEEINKNSPQWEILGFVDTAEKNVGKNIGKYTVICTEDEVLAKNMQVSAAIGIGNPSIIKKVVERFKSNSRINFPNLIHPSTIWDQENIVMGNGNIICAGNIFTTDIQIGAFNIFNLGCTYGHDTKIKNYCVFNPGVNLSGGVEVGSNCLIGTGAKILQFKHIGEGAIVGAGAVVVKDVRAGATVIGVPAVEHEKKS